jgi:hypothetical protein
LIFLGLTSVEVILPHKKNEVNASFELLSDNHLFFVTGTTTGTTCKTAFLTSYFTAFSTLFGSVPAFVIPAGTT